MGVDEGDCLRKMMVVRYALDCEFATARITHPDELLSASMWAHPPPKAQLGDAAWRVLPLWKDRNFVARRI